tara:strand:- start:50 stop:949 length:900 start_codon:yes stop_codon:yes gene_type:complete
MFFLQKNKLSLFFIKSWIFMGFMMSFIAIFQTFGILPQIQDSILGLYSEDHYSINRGDIFSLKRATGLFIDPNFFVSYLILASILNRQFLKNIFFEIIIIFGVFSTLSRMGLIALILTYIISNNFKNSIVYVVWSFIFFFLLLLILPESFSAFFTSRFSEILNLSTYLNYNILGSIEMSSTVGRLLTLFAAKNIFLENFWFGVGIGNIRIAYESILGFSTVTHNTFLEFFVLSGVFGIIPTYLLIRFLKNSFQSQEIVIKRISVLFFVSFMFLSVITNVFLFYPIFFSRLISHIIINEK